jgi:hypothetical protein
MKSGESAIKLAVRAVSNAITLYLPAGTSTFGQAIMRAVACNDVVSVRVTSAAIVWCDRNAAVLLSDGVVARSFVTTTVIRTEFAEEYSQVKTVGVHVVTLFGGSKPSDSGKPSNGEEVVVADP